MNDDWNGFIVVSGLFIFMIIYCNYLQNMALAKRDWQNLRCNPLYMVLNSVTSNQTDAINNFSHCVNNI